MPHINIEKNRAKHRQKVEAARLRRKNEIRNLSSKERRRRNEQISQVIGKYGGPKDRFFISYMSQHGFYLWEYEGLVDWDDDHGDAKKDGLQDELASAAAEAILAHRAGDTEEVSRVASEVKGSQIGKEIGYNE